MSFLNLLVSVNRCYSSVFQDVAVLRKEELCVYSKPLLPLGWRRTTTPSRQFLRSTISCERSTVVEQNSGSKSLISRWVFDPRCGCVLEAGEEDI